MSTRRSKQSDSSSKQRYVPKTYLMRRIKKYFQQKLNLDPNAQLDYFVQPIFLSY